MEKRGKTNEISDYIAAYSDGAGKNHKKTVQDHKLSVGCDSDHDSSITARYLCGFYNMRKGEKYESRY